MSKNERNTISIKKKLLMQAYKYGCGEKAEKDFEKAFELFSQAGQHIESSEIVNLLKTVFQKRKDILRDFVLKGIKQNDAFSFYILSECSHEYFQISDIPYFYKYELLDKAAEYGDVEMKLLVGRIYLDVLREETAPMENEQVDNSIAKTKGTLLIKQAAIMGYPEAQYRYFKLCESNSENNENISEGRTMCRKAAENGHCDAQYAMGKLLLTGDKYLKKNQTEGIELLKKSAKQGNTDAMIAIGDFCIKSHEKFEKTFSWYEKAAKKGDPRAKCILMLLGDYSYDLYTDSVCADLVCMSKENARASKLIDYLIANPDFSKEHGAIITKDSETGAIKIESIHHDDEFNDKMIDSSQIDEITELTKSAKDGDIEAMVKLGIHYFDAEDENRAEVWFNKAADRGDPRAKWYLTVKGYKNYDLYETAKEIIDMSDNGDLVATELVDFLLSFPAISATMGVVLYRDDKTNRILYRKPDESEQYEETSSSFFTERNIFDCNYQVVELFGHTVIYDDTRINKDELPKGYYCYDVRHGDNDYKPCDIEERVVVNHMGLIISNRPIELGEYGYRVINRRKHEWKYTDDVMTLRKYIEKFSPDDTIL